MTEAQRLVSQLLDGLSPRDFLKRVASPPPYPPLSQVVFKLYNEPEYDRPEGHFTDPEDVAWVRQQIRDGNEWAWCSVRVQATWWDRKTGKSYEGNDYLGGCSYESEESFKQPGGYYDDMKAQAYEDLQANVEADREAEED